ncbi:MAG: universal stress protein [Algibacter sp.]|uniref:universal stress protein n=1 Tax=Algibacter sp. TaxID=1872428 RepID=UPI002614A1CA|nr:universal stress protein [Algibacter sp.]MDG1729760.1 universal stress protein [Algibacter sp.]MDG2177914.1 universal stress protein [Algibacter sp.]
MKNILLPTDFSKNSINAIYYALEFLKDQECQFYILNVQKASSFITDDMMVVNSSTTIYKTLINAAKKSINNIITTIEEEFENKKHTFHSIVDYDNFIDAINQVSKNNSIDLIIMGTKGASGLEKMLFGSNTVRVMQRCKAPVLAIPDRCKFKSIDTIAFATTNSKIFKPEEVKILHKIITFNEASLKILHLADQNHLAYEAFDNLDFLDANFNNVNHEFIDTPSNEMFTIVHNYIQENNIDMLAIMNKKHSFLERLFTTHSVERFAFKIDIPLLVMQYQ